MSNAFIAFIAGIFVGAVIFELSKRAHTKMEFVHLFEGLVENETNDLVRSTLSKSEKRLESDLTN